MFYKNSSINHFDVSCNFLTNKGIINFIKSLEVNYSLNSINLYDNQLHNDIGNLILQVLQKNKSLVYINLYYNRIPMKKIEEINRFIKNNSDNQKQKFIPNLNNQDRPHWAEVYTIAKNITYLPVPYYYYAMNREGSITLLSDKKAFDVFRAFDEAEKVLHKNNCYDKLKTIHFAHYANNLIRILRTIESSIREDFVAKIKEANFDIDYNKFFKSDFYPFEKDNMRFVKFLKENDFSAINSALYRYGFWK